MSGFPGRRCAEREGGSRLFVVLLALVCAVTIVPRRPALQASDQDRVHGAAVGPLAQNGRDILNGFLLFLDEIGYRAGGRKIQLIVEDDEAIPAVGLTKAQKARGERRGAPDGWRAALVDRVRARAVHRLDEDPDGVSRWCRPTTSRSGGAASGSSAPAGAAASRTMRSAIRVPHARDTGPSSTIALDYAFGWESVGGFQRTFEAEGGRIDAEDLDARLGARLRAVSRADPPRRRCRVRAVPRPVRAAVHEAIPGVRVEGSRDADRRRDDHRRARAAVHGRRGARRGDGACTTAPRSTRRPTKRSPSLSRALQEGAELLLGEHVHGRQVARRRYRGASAAAWKIGQALVEALETGQADGPAPGAGELDEYGNPIENVYIRRVERVNGELQNTVIDTFPRVSQFWKYDPAELSARAAVCEIAR